ncbi:hypothetical protein BH11BAC6_BH11BAC6_00860 [soil metagenome]
MYLRIKIFVLLVLSFHFLSAQTKKIDSLKKIVDNAATNDERVAAIVAYCEDYSNINKDSLEKYTYAVLDLAATSKNERLKSLAQLTLYR